MGIKNLKKFLRGEYKSSVVSQSLFTEINISDLAGQKIAIDISSYLYKYKIVNGEQWIKVFPQFLTTLKRNQIHAIFIFDGTPPVEKDRECARRRLTNINNTNILDTLEGDIITYNNRGSVSDILREYSEKTRTLNSERCNKMLHAGIVNNKSYIDIDEIEKLIARRRSQNIRITQEDTVQLKELLTVFGVPYIQAPGEAESLAAYLYSKNLVYAVLTEDTDILAYGVEYWISGFNLQSGNCTLCVHSTVLKTLDFSRQQFCDFCIACGCDYGDNIRGVGIALAYKNIVKHKSLDLYIEHLTTTNSTLDHSVLNHICAREIFQQYGRIDPSVDYRVDYWDIITVDSIFEYLDKIYCKYSRDTINSAWSPTEITFSDEDEDCNYLAKESS